MKSIDSIDIRGKRILLRVDLNSPVENGKIIRNPRLVAHATTIKKLSERGARLIVLAHQGRKGHHDFTSLDQHARHLQDLTGRKIIFIDDVIGIHVTKAIDHLQDGEVLLLDNVRFLHDETENEPSESLLVKGLRHHADYFVLDSLSIAHRKQASVVGFANYLPSFAGPVLFEEITALNKVMHCNEVTFIFGGAKPQDSFPIMKHWLATGKVHKVLAGGVLGTLLLYAKGYEIGTSKAFLEKTGALGLVGEAKQELENYPQKIILPTDVALRIEDKRVEVDVSKVKDGGIWDIGAKTIAHFSKIIKESKVIVVNGPLGVYEIVDFAKGTKEVFKSLENYDSFTLCGGGHTITALEIFDIDRSKLGYVSLAGKAFIEYLSGVELPGIEALKHSKHV